MTSEKRGGANRGQGRKPNPNRKTSFNRKLNPDTIEQIKAMAIIKGISETKVVEQAVEYFKRTVQPMSIHKRDE